MSNILFNIVCSALYAALLVMAGTGHAQAQLHPVGLRQLEFVDGDRHLALTVFYPASRDGGGRPFTTPFFTNLNLQQDAPADSDSARLPLVMFSHGRGSNGLLYAWFGEYLAARGYIVAALNHYRANTYDANIAYLANKLWQRPVDIGLAISFLLRDEGWRQAIDPGRIGVAGHSQGGSPRSGSAGPG
jgi:predicted dienelactone hydrolase